MNWSRTRTYGVWRDMRQRCNNPKNAAYKDYGGRGIKVCERWEGGMEAFLRFLEDLGEQPPRQYLDRINNDGNYEPSNCRWVDSKSSARNRRSNRLIEFNGEKLCLTDWRKKLGFGLCVIDWRLKQGWSIERALTTPPSTKYRSKNYGQKA